MSGKMRLVPPVITLSHEEYIRERDASHIRRKPSTKGVSLKDPNWIDGREHYRRQFAKFTGDGDKPKKGGRNGQQKHNRKETEARQDQEE